MMVKICGITNVDDALAAVEAGVTALGFNFWPHSPRFIPPATAARLFEALPAGVLKVGLFVNEPSDAVKDLAAMLALDVVQLHGDAPLPSGLRIWKAIAVTPAFRAGDLDQYQTEAFVMDAPAGAAHGGTGATFDWERVSGLSQRIILAGGLHAGNVKQAILVVKPWGVDACSRLESAPGRKDHAKMTAFIRAALFREAE